MRKIWIIACREYLAAVRTKAFLISLVFMPLLMLGSMGAQVLIDRMAAKETKRFAIIDRTPGQKIFPVLEAAAKKRNKEPDPHSRSSTGEFVLEEIEPSGPTEAAIRQQRYDLSQRVQQGELAGFLDIGPKVMDLAEPTKGTPATGDPGSVRYQSNNPMQDSFARWAERIVTEAVVAQRCRDAGLSRSQVENLVRPVALQVTGLVRKDPESGALEETPDAGRVAMLLVPAGLTLLLFLVVMVGATPLMQGVIEEKMQRIAEVLLGSVRPFELMMGKLLGMMGVSLTLAAVYLGGAFWVLHHFGLAEYLPLYLLAWFLVYQVLAVLLYGSLFIAIGAACTDARESQTLMLPVVLLITLPLFGLRHVLQEPTSTFSTVATLFPFATPMLMITRLAITPAPPWWLPVLGVAGVLAATVLCVYAAGRIFRVGILLQGKGASLKDMTRWLFRG